jgi:Rod binding domain-containing protein
MSTALESSAALGATSGLPLVNQALEPAAVRKGSAATQKAYASALDFEQMLVQQLSQSLISTTGLEGSGAEGAEGSSAEEGSASEGGGEALAGMGGAANSQLASMLPQSLTEGVMSQGGLGLAQQLMTQLEPASSASSTAGTAPGRATAPGTVAATGGSASAAAGTASGTTVGAEAATTGAPASTTTVAPSGGVAS